MTTATTNRPVADNDFPVLMRLPDLNAPVWAAPLVSEPATILSTPNPSVATLSSAPPTQLHQAVVESPQLPPTAGTSVPSAEPPMTPVATTEPVAVAAPAPSSERTPILTRLQPYMRADALTPNQWTLVRQIAGGAILVGGLAVTYMAIMGGGKEPTPDHIPVAQQTTEPPLIEFNDPSASTETGLVIVPPQNTPGNNPAISDVVPPPDFEIPADARDYRGQSHLRIAEMPPDEPPPAWQNEANSPRNPRGFQDNLSGDSRFQSPEANGEYRGRIGPEVTVTNPEAPRYPETNPETYLYRPTIPSPGPNDERPYEARLRGTIAPPPLR